MADKKQQAGAAAAGSGAGAAPTGSLPPSPPPPITVGSLPLPDPARIRVMKRKVADRIMQAIERAGQRELTALSISDAAEWNVKRPDIQELALTLTDDAFGKLITTARDRLRTGLAEELGKNQDQFQIAANLRERFGGMNERDARRVVRTVFRDLYNTASLDVYDAIGVKQVLAADGHGGLTGRTDPECLARNGQTFTIDEARELRAYHPTVHPNCTLSFSPIMPEGGLTGRLDLPPVEDAPEMAAELGGSDSDMLMASWTPDEEALHPKWPAGTGGVDPSGHHLAGEFMEMGQLASLFKSLADPSHSVNVSFLAQSADNIASVKVTGGPPGGYAKPDLQPITGFTGAGGVKKLQHIYDNDGTYVGQIIKKSTSGYYGQKIYVKYPPGGAYGGKYIYGSDLPGGYQVSDNPPSEMDPSVTFDIILKHPKMGQPTHIQVHIDHASKMKTQTFVKFMAALNNGDDLATAKAALDATNKYQGGKQYAKPVITKKLNYAKFQKTIGGGKQEGNAVQVTTLKVGDTFLIPGTWDEDNEGEIGTVTGKWSKTNGYLSYTISSGPNTGTYKNRHIGYYGTDEKVTFGAAAKPPPPPPKIGQTVEVERLKIGSKVEIPVGTEGVMTSPEFAGGEGSFKVGDTPYQGTVVGIAPGGGIKVNTSTPTPLSVNLPNGTQVKFTEAPPKGGGTELQPGILDQFDISPSGKVTPPIASHAVDSSSHDPSIILPDTAMVSPEMWLRFGKEDQERYVYLQQKFGLWADGKGKTAMNALKASINHQIKSHVETAYNKQYGSTGASGVVTPESTGKSGGSGHMTLNVANAIPQSTWQAEQKVVDPEGQFGSWAEAINYGLLRWEEVSQWDMYNRVGEPDLLMFHAGGGSTKSHVIDKGVPITGGYSWSYYPGVWHEPTVDAIPLPIRYLTMNYFVPPSGGHLPSEHEVASRYFINVPKDSPYWYHAETAKYNAAWKWGNNPQGGSKWAQIGQSMGIIKLSPQEAYIQTPTVKAKTMQPGAKFKILTAKGAGAEASSGQPQVKDIIEATVAQVYSDGSFSDDAGRYFPANADIKQITPGKIPKQVGKLVQAPLSDTQMGNKVYAQDGKVMGYVSTPGQSWKQLADDGVTVTEKVTPGDGGTIWTVMPIEAGDMAAGDQFYVPGSKGQKVAEVVTNNNGSISWKQVGGTDTGTLPNAHSPVYPLPKPDSAFAPPPDPPAGKKPYPYIDVTPDVPSKVQKPYIPPPPVSGATLAEPAAAQVTHTPGVPASYGDVKVGDVLQVDQAAGQSWIGTKLEVKSATPDLITAVYLDGPQKGKQQTVSPAQWNKVTFSKVPQQPAGGKTELTPSEAKVLIQQAPASGEGLKQKKMTDAEVGDVLYSGNTSSAQFNKPFAVVVHVEGDDLQVYNTDSQSLVPFKKSLFADDLKPISVWTPGDAKPGAPLYHTDLNTGDKVILTGGSSFYGYHGKIGVVTAKEQMEGGKVKTHIAFGGEKTGALKFTKTAADQGAATFTKVEEPAAPAVPGTLPPGAPETGAGLPLKPGTEWKIGDVIYTQAGGVVGTVTAKDDQIITVTNAGTGNELDVTPQMAKILPVWTPPEAVPQGGLKAYPPQLTKTKVSTMKVGDHLYSYTTENYVGEVTAKNADGGVTVTKPDGGTKNYGAKSSVKKGGTAPEHLLPGGSEPAAPVAATPKEQMPASLTPDQIVEVPDISNLPVGSTFYGAETDGVHKKLAYIVGPGDTPGNTKIQILTPGTNQDADIKQIDLPSVTVTGSAWFTSKAEAAKLGIVGAPTPEVGGPPQTAGADEIDMTPVGPVTQVMHLSPGDYFATTETGPKWVGHVLANEGDSGNITVAWVTGASAGKTFTVEHSSWDTPAVKIIGPAGLFDEGQKSENPALHDIATKDDVGKLVAGDKIYLSGKLLGTVVAAHNGEVTYNSASNGLPNVFSPMGVPGGGVQTDHPLPETLAHEQPVQHHDIAQGGAAGAIPMPDGAILNVPHDAMEIQKIKYGGHIYGQQGHYLGQIAEGEKQTALGQFVNVETPNGKIVPVAWGTPFLVLPPDHPEGFESVASHFVPNVLPGEAPLTPAAPAAPEVPSGPPTVAAGSLKPGDKVVVPDLETTPTGHVGQVGTVEKVGPGGITYTVPDDPVSAFIPASAQVYASAQGVPEPPAGEPPKSLIQISESGNKKASSFVVGQAAYSYHSGKLIGTVSATGTGTVEITKPDGTKKTYKATTTWRYDKNAPLPGAAPAAPSGPAVGDTITNTNPSSAFYNLRGTVVTVDAGVVIADFGDPYGVQPVLSQYAAPGGAGGAPVVPEPLGPQTVDPHITVPLHENAPDHPSPVYSKAGLLLGTFDPQSPYNQPGVGKFSSIGNGGGIAEYTKTDGTVTKIGAGNLYILNDDAPQAAAPATPTVNTLEVGDTFTLPDDGATFAWAAGMTGTIDSINPTTSTATVKVITAPHATHMEGQTAAWPGIGPMATTPVATVTKAGAEPPSVHLPPGVAGFDAPAALLPNHIGIYYNGKKGKLEKYPSPFDGQPEARFVPDDGSPPTTLADIDTPVGYQTQGDEGLAPLPDVAPPPQPEPAPAPAPTPPNPATLLTPVSPQDLNPMQDVAGVSTGTPLYTAWGEPLGTYHHEFTWDDGTEVIAITDTDGNGDSVEASYAYVHVPGAGSTPPAAPEPVPGDVPHMGAIPPEPSVGHPEKIDPKANPSKKAGSMVVGQPVYNYHSGKLIGTVKGHGAGEGVTVETPGGDLKHYKATTTWKYLGGSAGAANAPATSSAPETPQDVLGHSSPPAPVQEFSDLGNWNNMGAAGGTQGAQWFTDPASGQKYVVKAYGGDQSRVATEALAGAIYKALGVDVPDTGVGTMVDGSRVFVSKALPGNPKPKVLKGQPKSQQLGQGFMADALLANHDVVGLDDDNILWDANGKPYRVDVGGTFFYRAMGGPKAFGPEPNEIKTMLDPKRQAGRSMIVTPQMLKEQAANIGHTLTPAQIHALVESAGFPTQAEADKVEQALLARVAHMKQYAEGTWKPE